MELRQRYERASTATLGGDTLGLDLAAESSRPGVFLDATVRDGLAYARAMLALHAVVRADHAGLTRDHSDYQRWVQERYLELIPEVLRHRRADANRLTAERAELAAEVASARSAVQEIDREIRSLLPRPTGSDGFYAARREYYRWLYEHDREAWIVLDPVVSVHPDAVLFEVFSRDESAYGRVSLPMTGLDLSAPPAFGTTNVDFSPALAAAIGRIRSYRPATLHVGGGAVGIGTEAGSAVEKKIDLPPGWVRGFLQVQSAAALPGVGIDLMAATVADVLAHLERQREDHGPRSLRFRLQPGEPVEIEIEPWGTVVTDHGAPWRGTQPEEIRVWGRRRLAALRDLLPHADLVRVRLLGSGMPSFWSVALGEARFDLGLSGWSGNDWSRRAAFDVLAAGEGTPRVATRVAALLGERLRLTPAETADALGIARSEATSALQRLVGEGRAMYDDAVAAYRWRQLFPSQLALELPDPLADASLARSLVARGAVEEDGEIEREGGRTVRRFVVHGQRDLSVRLDLDEDGRVVRAECSCAFFRANRLRKGPCAHIAAAAAVALRGGMEEGR